MAITYESFLQELAVQINRELPDHAVEVMGVLKAGDMRKQGISVRERESRIAVTIYPEEWYRRWNEEQMGMNEIVRSAVTLCQDAEKNRNEVLDFFAPKIREYEQAKESLGFRVLEIARNRKYLEDKVYTPIGNGLAKIYVLYGGGEPESKTSELEAAMVVTEELRGQWGVSAAELEETSEKNEVRRHPPVLYDMQNILLNSMGISQERNNHLGTEVETDPDGMYVLTNERGAYGAASFFYPGVQSWIAESIGGSYYAIPSSVHEVLVIPAISPSGLSAGELERMIHEVNRTVVSAEEKLSDHVMHYDALFQTLTMPCTNIPAYPQIKAASLHEPLKKVIQMNLDGSNRIAVGTFQKGELEQIRIDSKALGIERYLDFNKEGYDVACKPGLLDQFDMVEKTKQREPGKILEKKGPRI